MDTTSILRRLQLDGALHGVYAGGWREARGDTLSSVNPATAETIGTLAMATRGDYEAVATSAAETFAEWRMLPAPKRGEYVRRIGNALRDVKRELGALVTLEAGKILAEGEGEVQEMIDIADFAVGLSRQLYGLTMASERPRHRMYEQWHPLGPCGIISAFNFPVAVWSWNAFIAAVCGDTTIWKPSLRTPLTALAVTDLCHEVMAGSGFEGVFNLVVGTDEEVGSALVNDERVPLISATGSCNMGRVVGPAVLKRFGRPLLELGGNNAILVMDDADLDLATRAATFAAVGTAGQRCTSLRRLLVHSDVVDEMTGRLIDVYKQVRIGDPLEEQTLMGPLISEGAAEQMMTVLDIAREQGGEVVYGGNRLESLPGTFVEPTLVRIDKDAPIVQEETFAPILWIIEVGSLEEGITVHNGVRQGLSSAIFTESIRNAETFLSHLGSDCGIANVNIGTSGAEIGGAFGGEKETGGGREAGSDSWKAYMRRQTTTINWGGDLPLAQGIEFV
ncbi:MAG: aldehyde dehydrogenase family protein [Acidimicrobiia bacterium]|nr:aldehyde dehydrogenase family protein [Acidimicrobiia bacterium]NNL69441.1 aldehyde dehydrogenase family protein [Acidimicrobiia bacterium]